MITYRKKLYNRSFEEIYDICRKEETHSWAAAKLDVAPSTLCIYLSELRYKDKVLTYSDLRGISKSERTYFFLEMERQLDLLKSKSIVGKPKRVIEEDGNTFKEESNSKKAKISNAEPISDPSEPYNFNLFSKVDSSNNTQVDAYKDQNYRYIEAYLEGQQDIHIEIDSTVCDTPQILAGLKASFDQLSKSATLVTKQTSTLDQPMADLDPDCLTPLLKMPIKDSQYKKVRPFLVNNNKLYYCFSKDDNDKLTQEIKQIFAILGEKFSEEVYKDNLGNNLQVIIFNSYNTQMLKQLGFAIVTPNDLKSKQRANNEAFSKRVVSTQRESFGVYYSNLQPPSILDSTRQIPQHLNLFGQNVQPSKSLSDHSQNFAKKKS